ncbi:ester cyclase [Nocardia tengchongensis]|uniref:Ester cyclase n=1 Tax=Nocardia tengchongensis TaxID=2055889 RepID=A0ABX8CTB9_9NOCA|nr:ester cyclase [Nocardia tengchongensis]QVI21780.1 ester cyclase [Nocardia tengchongensis]
MSEQNKATARRVFDAWNSRDLDVFDEIVAPDAIDHDPQNPHSEIHGPNALKRQAEMYIAAFSDTRMLVNEQIAEGDFVVTRWTASGTNDGPMMGMPATGKPVVIQGMTITRFQTDGKIGESLGELGHAGNVAAARCDSGGAVGVGLIRSWPRAVW